MLKNKTNQLHGTIEAVKSVSAPDKNTFVLHLATRDSEFLDKLAIPILPKHIWSKIPIAKLDKVDGPVPTVTTAPYVLTKWEKLGTTILSRNEKYDTFRNDGKLPDVKRILITYYANPDSVYRDVNQGHLDYGYGGQPSWARRAKTDNNKNVQLVSSPRGGYWEIAFNSCPKTGSPICSGPGKDVKTAVVQDPAIRKAVAYAIDREKFIPTVYDGQGTTAYGLISPRFKRYYVDRKNTPARLRLRPRQGEGGAEGRRLGLLADARARRTASRPSSSSTRSARARRSSRMAQRVKADVGEGRDRHRPQLHDSDDALNNRIYASGKTKDLYAPNYDAFLWDWDVERHDADADHGGAALEQRLERLLLRQQGLRQGADRRTYGDQRRGQTVAAVRKAEAVELGDLPYLPLVHLNAVELHRTDTWHGWLPSPSPVRPAAVRGGAADPRAQDRARPPATAAAAPAAATVDGRRRLADDAALRPDRLGADLARDPGLVVHQQRAQEDRAARVD